MPKSPRKDPLALPKKGDDKVKGGMLAKRTTALKDCNSNTLTCKDTSTSNTLCCT